MEYDIIYDAIRSVYTVLDQMDDDDGRREESQSSPSSMNVPYGESVVCVCFYGVSNAIYLWLLSFRLFVVMEYSS